MGAWQEFRQCPGCGFDLATGDGERGCSWGECPYLPEDLDVYCPNCRFNFLTMEGNSQCGRPGVCEHAAESRAHVPNLRAWLTSSAGGPVDPQTMSRGTTSSSYSASLR
ncbi:MAG TPA: hypothetical protein VLE71_07240 [Actinomycetota bacterium]|nr:hypothetical protein [Actinomycetota bacterium]